MTLEWKYVIELQEDSIVNTNKKYGIEIPKDLEELLKISNAGTPTKTTFLLEEGEKILGAILSFNSNEEDDVDSFENAMTIGFDKHIIPFGIDPFGNYICYNTNNSNIVFFNHEDDSIEYISGSLDEFLNKLY